MKSWRIYAVISAALPIILTGGVVFAASESSGSGPGTPQGSAPGNPRPGHPSPAEIAIGASVDTCRVAVGDLITYTVTISRPPQAAALIPVPDSVLGEFELRELVPLGQQVRGDETVVDGVEYVLTCFETGEHEIPPLPLGVVEAPGETIAIWTLPVPISVERVSPADAEEIKDIKDLIYPPGRFPLRAVLIGLAAAGLVAAAVLLLRRRRRFGIAPEEPGPPPLPPHEQAYLDLERIAARGLVKKGLIKEYYTELSEVIRRYIGGRYGIMTMELTTTELLASMREAGLDREEGRAFRQFLARCDLVKFAKHIPPPDEMEGEIGRARSLVDATKVVEPAPEREPAEVGAGAGGEVER
jgi:hypothetical protein